LPLEIQRGEVAEFELYFAAGRRTRYLVAVADLHRSEQPLVRIESACLFGHVFRSRRCDCGYQLQLACDRIAREGGLVVYGIDEDGRGLGIERHFETYLLRQQEHLDTTDVYRRLGVSLDQRDYSDVVDVLRHFGLTAIRILTNNPRRLEFLDAAGIRYTRQPHERPVDQYSAVSMMDKASALPYLFSFPGHAVFLRRLRLDAGERQIRGLVLEDFSCEKHWSLSRRSAASEFAAMTARSGETPARYRILYASAEPPLAWLAAASAASFDLVVLPRRQSTPGRLAAVRELGFVVDTVDVDALLDGGGGGERKPE
jgi:GTP cyclohydrolase II